MNIKTKREILYSANFFIDNDSDRIKKLKEIFRRYRGSNALDIGCGTGNLTQELQKFSHEVFGVEISKEAGKIAEGKGIKVSYLDVDDDNLPFVNGFFDIIFCGELIEHLFDPDHLLDEIFRTLKTKGIAVITTPNLGSYLNRISLLFGFQPYLTGTGLRYNTGKFFGKQEPCPHLIVFTLRSLKELLQLHHFKIREISGANSSHLLRFYPFKIFDNLLTKIPSLATQLIFVVEKL